VGSNREQRGSSKKKKEKEKKERKKKWAASDAMKGHQWFPCSPMGSLTTLQLGLSVGQGILNMGSG